MINIKYNNIDRELRDQDVFHFLLTHNGRVIADDIYYCRSNKGKLEITALVNRHEDKFYDFVEDFNDYDGIPYESELEFITNDRFETTELFNDLSIEYKENYET